MPEREYVITEHFRAEQYIYVRATSKKAALAKVLGDGAGYTERGDIYPKRAMSVRDVEISAENRTCEVCGGSSSAGYPWGNQRVPNRCFPHATI